MATQEIPEDEFYTDEDIAAMCAEQEQALFDHERHCAEREAAQAEQEPASDDASDEDELTERRREYHDMLDADFRRLGLVEW